MASSSNNTSWFVGIIIALALLAIGYLVFTAQDTSTAASQPLTEAEKTWFMECLKYSYIADCRTRLDYIRTME